MAFLIVIVVAPVALKNGFFCKLIGAKKGHTFLFNLFLRAISIYYILHNYVIPQAMPHAIPQHSFPLLPSPL